MGVAFASRRTTIDCRFLGRFGKDDCLRELGGGLAEAVTGDLVVYYRDGNPQHVGVITQIGKNEFGGFDVLVLSKWGEGGEYIHKIDDVPEIYGRDKRFITDRK
ncbi:MAG TPA: hypothetical protein VFO29_01530 [Candidatus Rubrimentiphilum sp.]|nr:hypothetical protein [Candidatus Rubrimentiphilum sp.]